MSSQTAQIQDDEEKQIRSDFDKYGVPERTQDALIDKLESGEPLDAFLPEEDPVSTESLGVNNGYQEEISWYEDGSYVVSSVEVPDSTSTSSDTPEIQPLGMVYACEAVWTNGSWKQWRDCSVVNNWAGVINIAFLATFEKSSVSATINSVGNVTQNCAVTSCSRPDVWIGNRNMTATTAAWAQAQSTVDASWGSWEVWLQLRVNTNGYWTENS